jgi:flagellar basal body-associated protein FliL
MFGLVNEANFFVVIIALLIITFLLGLIIGLLINRKNHIYDNSSKQNAAPVSNDNPQPANPVEQNIVQDNNQEANAAYNRAQRIKDLRYKYFYYW